MFRTAPFFVYCRRSLCLTWCRVVSSSCLCQVVSAMVNTCGGTAEQSCNSLPLSVRVTVDVVSSFKKTKVKCRHMDNRLCDRLTQTALRLLMKPCVVYRHPDSTNPSSWFVSVDKSRCFLTSSCRVHAFYVLLQVLGVTNYK